MTRYSLLQLRWNPLFVFRFLVRYPGVEIKLVAVPSIFLCVICAWGLGGMVLEFERLAAWLFGYEWSPDIPWPWARISLGVVWTVLGTIMFATLLFSGFRPRATLCRESTATRIIEATEQLVVRCRPG